MGLVLALGLSPALKRLSHLLVTNAIFVSKPRIMGHNAKNFHH